MKKLCLLLLLSVLSASINTANAQTAEVTQLILNLEKLNQLRKILTELKKGYEILFKGYSTIKNLSEGNFKLHQTFLDGLLTVSPAVKKYKRIGDIIENQLQILKECKVAYSRLQSGNYFNKDELDYMGKIYSRLVLQSADNLGPLINILTDKKLRMSDDERLAAIDAIHDDMLDKLVFIRHFNSSNTILAVQRAKQFSDVQVSEKLHGLQ